MRYFLVFAVLHHQIMTPGLVSVVIPTFNRAYCLTGTLNSLQQQTYPDWEAIVVDDGSTDGTTDLVTDIQKHDSRVCYSRQTNRGVSAARNNGLRQSRGEWIAFLDSDDAWEPWKLEAQVACFKHRPDVGMVWTDMNAVDSDSVLVKSRYLRTMYSAYGKLSEERIFDTKQRFAAFDAPLAARVDELKEANVLAGNLYCAMFVGNLVHTSTAVLRRERAEAVGFFNEKFRSGEDYDFHFRTCLAGPVALLDAPAVRYRNRGGDDQLTARRYGVDMATNALLTREAMLARNGKPAGLSEGDLADILAETNNWVGQELFNVASYAAARPHLWKSLRYKPSQPKTFIKALLTSLPSPVLRAVLRINQQLRAAPPAV